MGMGFVSCTKQVIKYDDLKKLCPDEVAAVESVYGFEGWGSLAGLDDVDEEWLEASKETIELSKEPLDALRTAFHRATSVDGKGLELVLTYYNPEDGDRYDEVEHLDGCIFEVQGAYQMTPAGEKFKDKIHTASYVVFA